MQQLRPGRVGFVEQPEVQRHRLHSQQGMIYQPGNMETGQDHALQLLYIVLGRFQKGSPAIQGPEHEQARGPPPGVSTAQGTLAARRAPDSIRWMAGQHAGLEAISVPTGLTGEPGGSRKYNG